MYHSYALAVQNTCTYVKTFHQTVHMSVKGSLKIGNFVLFLTKHGGLWLGKTGGLSTQVKMKSICALESGV